LEKKKINKNLNFLFLLIIFEKKMLNLFYIQKTKSTLISSNDQIVQNSIFFFTETKPLSLLDLTCFDYNYDISSSNSISSLYTFFSSKNNKYLYILNMSPDVKSSSNVFTNLVWLEREQNEFFGLNVTNIKDSRNLLLEYNFSKKIFLKKYNVFDYNPVYYNGRLNSNVLSSL